MSADTDEVTPPSDDTEEVTPPPDVTLGEEPQSEDQSSCCSLLCFPTCWRNSFPFFSGQQNPESLRSLRSSLNFESPESHGALRRRIRSRETPTSSSFDFHRSNDSMDQPLSVSARPPPPPPPPGAAPPPPPLIRPLRPLEFSSSDISFRSVELAECYSLSTMRSIRSMNRPTSSSFDFYRSNASMDPPPSFSGQQSPESLSLCSLLNVDSPERLSASASMRSIRSMDPPISFRAEPDGVRWSRPGLKKYLCELVPDTDTMNKNLQLSHDGRTVTYEDEVQKYPDHPHRFQQRPQLLCRNALTGRCYWEVDWTGIINIAVSSRGISREGDAEDCWFGRNDQSWSLYCSDRHGCTVTHKERPICSHGHFLAYHDNNPTTCSTTSSQDSNRAAVYVDVPAGTLSFFVVSGDELIHLHTFHTTFTDTLYPGFGFWGGSGASVSLPSV